MWEGETCAVLASGPSMSQEIADWVRASGVKTIAVCRTWELAPWADMIYAADAEWWRRYRPQVRACTGLKVCVEVTMFPEVLILRAGDKQGFDPDPGRVATGGNSGYQAVHVAVHAGCKRILLCGFDMHGGHWHADYPRGMKTHNAEYLENWAQRFDSLKEPLRVRGVEVINCTERSAIKTWRYLPLDVALPQKGAVSRCPYSETDAA